MRRSLTKDERIRKKKDFTRLFASPFRYQTLGMKLFYSPKNSLMFGVTFTKGFSSAVIRNKNKRWIKELFRNWKADTAALGFYLFVLQPGDYSFADRKNQFFEILKKIEVKKLS